jgi:hypothetical protein
MFPRPFVSLYQVPVIRINCVYLDIVLSELAVCGPPAYCSKVRTSRNFRIKDNRRQCP